jgi:hypothetical protein
MLVRVLMLVLVLLLLLLLVLVLLVLMLMLLVLVLMLSSGTFGRAARSWHCHRDAVGVSVGLYMRGNVHMCRRLALVSRGLRDGANGMGLLLLCEIHLTGCRVVRGERGSDSGCGCGMQGGWGGVHRVRRLQRAAAATRTTVGVAAAVGAWRGVSAKEVLEDGEVCHGSIDHLRESVVSELGRDKVPAPELLLGQAPTLVHLLLDVAHGAVHREGHAIARDDRIVDDVRVGELFVHHVECLNKL